MAAPARTVDARGLAVELPAPPRRIVSLIPSTTELLADLGLGAAIVGVTAYCREPAAVVARTTRVGGEKDPDLELIVRLEPDLVIANVEENVREHVEGLQRRGLSVFVTHPRTVDGALALVRDLGSVTGAVEAAAALGAELAAAVAAARARAAGRRPVGVFYPIWRDPWMTIGGDTYIHDVLALAGGRNVFGERARYPIVTLADMAARRPDVILLPDEPYRFRRAHLAELAPWTDAPAVRAGRVRFVDGKLASWHGRRLLAALRELPPLLSAGAED